MIRPCVPSDFHTIVHIINEAAEAYRGVIPPDCWHEPYMTADALAAEINQGVRFWGWDEQSDLIGVMGVQRVADVTLIRHAYVRSSSQRTGVGGALLDFLAEQISGPVLVGTWADAAWAIRFYQKHGFQLVPVSEKDTLLSRYWTISPRQKETSVVLVRQDAAPPLP